MDPSCIFKMLGQEKMDKKEEKEMDELDGCIFSEKSEEPKGHEKKEKMNKLQIFGRCTKVPGIWQAITVDEVEGVIVFDSKGTEIEHIDLNQAGSKYYFLDGWFKDYDMSTPKDLQKKPYYYTFSLVWKIEGLHNGTIKINGIGPPKKYYDKKCFVEAIVKVPGLERPNIN